MPVGELLAVYSHSNPLDKSLKNMAKVNDTFIFSTLGLNVVNMQRSGGGVSTLSASE